MGALDEVDRGVDDVAEHGARRRVPAGAAAVEHQRADGATLDEHGVVAVAHAGQRVMLGHHRRVDADADLAAVPVDVDDGEQLDDVAESAGDVDVGERQVADPLVVHLAGDDLGARGDRRHDRRLGPGVEALDVGGRVTLGVAEALGLGEGGLVGHPLLGHLREDVVRRPVDDAHHPRDRLAAQALAQRPHDRDAPGDCRLEEQVDAGLLGDLEQLDADVGEQLLVGGDHRLARRERRGDQLAGGFDATDDLDDEVDVGIGDDGERRRW